MNGPAPGGAPPKAGEIPGLLKRFGIEAKRGLSQNFLVNDGACAAIADACIARGGGHAIEIGAGPATLTRLLARRAARVTAFEIDERFRPFHEAHPLPANVTMVYGDFLEADLPSLIRPGEPTVVAGNIPYAITGLLFRRALDPRLPIERVCLLVQEEVARRVVGAHSGERGLLAVAAWLFGDARIALVVRPGSFHPAPKVRSAAVVVERSPRDLNGFPPDRFMAFARRAFSARRKTIANTLSGGDARLRERVRETLAGLALDPEARADTLPPHVLVALACALEGETP